MIMKINSNKNRTKSTPGSFRQRSLKKTKIMIVEDEAITAMDMKTRLSRLGYDVCKVATTGKEAIKNARQEGPDIVIMDIILNGEMDGIEAAKEIHSHKEEVSIIFTAGRTSYGTRRLADEAGPVAYLAKPVEAKELELAIDLALRRNKKMISG